MANKLKKSGNGKRLPGVMMIFSVFILAIIAVSFLSPIGDRISDVTTTRTLANSTITAPAANATLTLQGKFVESDTLDIFNSTGATGATGSAGISNAAGNYTVTNEVLVNGQHTSTIQVVTANTNYSTVGMNISYTYRPIGYITNSGGRNVTTLVLIIAALALLIGIVALFFASKNFRNILTVGGNK